MMTAAKTYVTFRSGAFNTTEAKEYFVNPCCFGDDLAKWLINEMQRRNIEVDDEPSQEDFGWYISFRIGAQQYNFIVGYNADDRKWHGWLERDVGLLASLFGKRNKGIEPDAIEAINNILASSPVIQDLHWQERDV